MLDCVLEAMRRASPGGTVHRGHAPGVPDMYEAPNGDYYCNAHRLEYCHICCVDHRELNDMCRGSDAGGDDDDDEASIYSDDDGDMYMRGGAAGLAASALRAAQRGDRTRDYYFEMAQALGSQIFGAPLLETRQRAQARMLERMGATARGDEGRVLRARALLAQAERQAGAGERTAAAERAARQAAIDASWVVDLPPARGGGGGGGGKKKKGGDGKKKGKGKGKGTGKNRRAAAGGGGGGSGTSGGGGGPTTRARAEEEEDEEDEQEEEEEEEEQTVREEKEEGEEKARVPDPDPEPEAEPDLMELHDDDCPICFMSIGYKPDELNLALDCQHTFHRVCILDWRDTCRSKREPISCPMCRQSVTQEDWNKMNE